VADQSTGDVKVRSEAPAKAIALEADGIKKIVREVSLAF
jgi:hypothetical protein